ncbi:hypothetical protein CCP3SC15_710014 [Gammaproteobacteria bacterium]
MPFLPSSDEVVTCLAALYQGEIPGDSALAVAAWEQAHAPSYPCLLVHGEPCAPAAETGDLSGEPALVTMAAQVSIFTLVADDPFGAEIDAFSAMVHPILSAGEYAPTGWTLLGIEAEPPRAVLEGECRRRDYPLTFHFGRV